MALGTYQDVYKLSDLQTRVKDITDALNIANGEEMLHSMEERVKAQISLLEKREQVIYAYLHLPKEEQNIKGLNKRLTQYRNAVISLSGPQLEDEITGVLDRELGKQFADFSDAVNEVVEAEIWPLLEQGYYKNFEDAYLGFLNTSNKGSDLHKEFVSAGTKFSNTTSLNKITKRVLVGALTPHQRKFWEKILDKSSGANPGTSEIQPVNNQIHFNWLGYTDGKTETEAEKELSITQRQNMSYKIREKLIDLVAVDNQKAFTQVLDYILQETQWKAFFVGKSVNDIIGLCGEIQSIYYLYCFLGCDPSTLGNEIKWMGGKHVGEKGQKPHRDALLQVFGIQVKNSVSQELKAIDFADASIETILQKIGVGGDEVRNLIANFYGTKYFNIGYNINWQTGKYYVDIDHPLDVFNADGTNRADIYKETYSELVSKSRDIERLLAFSAATLMYMDIGDIPGKLDANSLYLLGGATFYAASNILNRILELFRENKDAVFRAFRVHSSSSKDSRTIVDALNNNNRSPNYSEEVLKKIILTTSFNFGSITDIK